MHFEKMKRYFSALSLLVSVLLLASCNDEVGESSKKYVADKNTVAFVIGGNSSMTRADVVKRDIVAPSNVIDLPCEPGETPLCIVETVTDMDEVYTDAVLGTRATPAYTENFYDLYGKNNQLYGTAFASQSGNAVQFTDVWGSYLDNGGTVNYRPDGDSDNTYIYCYSKGQTTNLSWPSDNKLWFFLEAPYDYGTNSSKSDTKGTNREFWSDGSIRFHYTDPNTATDGVITNGAVNQTDFLFTSKLVSKPAQYGPKSNILMYHSLTGVKFQMGNIDGGITTIKSVTITNINSKGDCVLTPNYTDANTSAGDNESNHKSVATDKSKSAQCAVWKNQGTPVSYTETFNMNSNGTTNYGGYEVDENSNPANFAKDFYKDGNDADRDHYTYNLNDANGTKTLYLVPQTLTADSKIIVEYQVGDKIYKREASLAGEVWKAGELHTYTLTVNKVDVSITDEMNDDNTVKGSVVATNTGNVTAYLRAAVVAAWCYGDDTDFNNAVAPYVYATNDYTLGTGWVQGADGFFYYTKPVKAGQSTAAPLFESFTPHTASPFAGAHVEMKLFLQGVQFDESATTADGKKAKAVDAWGSTIANSLTTTPETPNN